MNNLVVGALPPSDVVMLVVRRVRASMLFIQGFTEVVGGLNSVKFGNLIGVVTLSSVAFSLIVLFIFWIDT